MDKRTQKKYITAADQLGWTLEIEGTRHHTATLHTCTTFGQDVCFEDLQFSDGWGLWKQISELYEGYDPSEEASLWLDDTGHGKNGAPWAMGDVYKDMVEVETMLHDLEDKFFTLYRS